jgi:hypothetical protein
VCTTVVPLTLEPATTSSAASPTTERTSA